MRMEIPTISPLEQRFRIRGGKSKKLNQFCPTDKQGQVLGGGFELPGTARDFHFAAQELNRERDSVVMGRARNAI